MSLYDESKNKQKDENRKKLKNTILIAIVIVVILIILSIIGIVYLSSQPNKLSVTLNGTKNNQLLQLLNVQIDESGSITQIYAPIKEMAEYLGYTAYNGSYTTVSEDTNSCNVRNEKEVAIFQLDSDVLRKKELVDNSKNTNYHLYKLDKAVFKENDMLYTTVQGIEKAYNVTITYDQENNIIEIYTLDQYIEDLTTADDKGETLIQKYGYAQLDETYTNQKAIIDDMLVVTTEAGEYGVIEYSTGKQILGAQYNSLTYIPENSAFLIGSNQKYGIISSEGKTKIKPAYDSLELIDNERELYLASNSGLYGIIDIDGNIIINLEYSKIGIDIEQFAENDVTNSYILQDKLIPVQQQEKWGFFDVTGNKITELIYDDIGCITSNTQGATFNLLQIPEYNTIIVKKNEKYGGILLDGTESISTILDDVYMGLSEGKVMYYMVRIINDKTQTRDIIEYLESRGITKNN